MMRRMSLTLWQNIRLLERKKKPAELEGWLAEDEAHGTGELASFKLGSALAESHLPANNITKR